MSDARTQSRADDERAIRQLIGAWAEAVRNGDRDGIRAHHDDDILMFDVPPPLRCRGLDDYMTSWDQFHSSSVRPIEFDLTDVEVTAGADVAFATAIGHCAIVGAQGAREPVDFRLTMGLRKVGGTWRVTHEHHSVPAV